MVFLSRARTSAGRSACIDLILFLVHHKVAKCQEEIVNQTQQAIDALELVQHALNLTAFEAVSFKFLKTHGIMLLAHNLRVDWDNHVSKLFRPLNCINTEVMDEDEVDILLTKGQALWQPNGTCMAHNALLLCNTVNQSSIIPLAKPWHGRVNLATVVWVASNQAWLFIPDAISTLLNMAKSGHDGVALCYMPISKPFFPYPDDGPHVLIVPYDNNIPNSLDFGMPADFSAYEMTSYTIGASVAVGLTARLQFGPERPLSTKEKQTVHFTTVENHGAVWSNQVYVMQTPNGKANIIHEVYLGDGVMAGPAGWQLDLEQHRQVIQAIAQNPTIASHFKTAAAQSGEVGDPVNISIPGHEYVLQVSKDDWLASGQTSSTTTMKGTPSTFRTHTPAQQTASLLGVIPSISTVGTQQVGLPSGFPALPEEPLKNQVAIREQIMTDGKTLTKASWVLCTDFCHMGKDHSQQMKAMREHQLQGIHDLKTQVVQALSDWRVDLSSSQCLLGMVPSTSLYTSLVADLQVKTYEMANKVKQVEVAYVEGKESTTKLLD